MEGQNLLSLQGTAKEICLAGDGRLWIGECEAGAKPQARIGTWPHYSDQYFRQPRSPELFRTIKHPYHQSTKIQNCDPTNSLKNMSIGQDSELT